MEFLSTIKTKYCTSSHDQKQNPPCYSSELVKLELVMKHKPTSKRGEHEPTSKCPDAQLVPYSDIFEKEKEQVVRRVLIEGGAGIGKTTFCLSISEDWAKGELFQDNHFKVLLLLSLHEKRIAAPRSLPELIQILQGVENVSADDIKEKNGEDVLIIADGWDELDAPECSQSFLCNLLFGHILELASIVVTSRPSYSDWLCKKGRFDRLLSIRGFDDGSIRQYIRLNCTDNQQESDRLLEIVDGNPQIKSMCHIPLNCATLCRLSREPKLSTTTTELCSKMVWNVVHHSINKADKDGSLDSVESLSEEFKSSWWDLCQLAFQTIQRIRIDLSQFRSNIIMLMKFGLVEIMDMNEVKCDFLHPAFQEYLAAFHVYHSPDTHKLIRSLDIKQITMFWRFLFGICGQSNSNLALLECAIQLLSKFDDLKCLICHCAFEAKNSEIDEKAIKALGTPKHFGDPQASHDCEAILYVIEKMRKYNLDAQLELNFKECDFKEQQLCRLMKILANNKIKVKSFDLSNQFNLPNKIVADLFNNANEALTAFESLEKLSLRDNQLGKKIGPEGAVYTMRALGFLKCLIQLDLSFNRLTISALKELHINIENNCFAQLEILLLHAALTFNAIENIDFLSTFTLPLMKYCRKLRILDISGNDLGEPGSPRVSAIICTLTEPGLNLYVDEAYKSEVDKNFIRIMEDLVKRQAKIDHTVVHGVIVGPARSGKNSLMDRLMNKGPPDPDKDSPSTGVLDNIIKVEVMKLCTMDAAATNVKWRMFEDDEETLELMKCTISSHIAALAEEGRKFEPVQDLIPQLDKHVVPSALIVKNKNENKVNSEDERETDCDKAVPEVTEGAVIHPHNLSSGMQNSYLRELGLRERLKDFLKRTIKLRHKMAAIRKHLESSWSLYLTNTGGQLEFQELLPLLVCGPSVFIVTFPLNNELDKPYPVPYQGLKSSEKPYLSSSTLLEEILQTLATIATLDYTGPRLEEVNHNIYKPMKPKVFFVGTHKDILLKSSAQPDEKIQEIDKRLQEIIKETSLYEQDSIEYAEGTNRLIFTVNNLDEGDDDFKKIRLAVQRMVDRQKDLFTISCPCSWLIFSLVLRVEHKSSQILSYKECFTAAQRCGISSRTDFNKALLFIHHRLGLVRYFPVKGLNDRVIIDPQIIFDAITKLIKETFISGHASARVIEEFQKRGIFSIDVMEEINSKNYPDSQLPFINKWVPELLNHLGIAVFFKDQDGNEKCFFPSLLCRAPEQQQSNVSNCSIKPPPPISIAFKDGFCPRAIPGTLIRSLMNNEPKSSIPWKLHQKRVFRNQVSFNVGPADIILKILPTHIEVCFDPESGTADQNEVNITCEEAYKQIKKVMHDINIKRDYYFAFNCTRPECKECPHPAKICWGILKLECRITERKSHLPDGYKLWTQVGAYQEALGDKVLDFNNEGVSLHLGQIADKMCEWEGAIAEQLGLIPAEIAAINKKYQYDLKLQTREVLKTWKRKLGSGATYNDLIKAFQQAGYEGYAEVVKGLLMNDVRTNTGSSNRDTTPPLPSTEQPSPVFPPESELFSESPKYAAAPVVKLQKHDYELENNPGNAMRIKVKDYEYNPAHQKLKQKSSEDDPEAQSENELEASSDTNLNLSDSMEREDASMKESKLGGGAQFDDNLSSSMGREGVPLKQIELGGGALSGNKLSGSMEGEDDLLNQSKLEGGTQSDKPSGSMERKEYLLKLGGGTRSDTKQSSSLENDNALKYSNLEAGQSTAKKTLHSSLDSVPSKRMKMIAPFDKKGKYFIGVTEAQSDHESKLGNEAPTDDKPSGSMEIDGALLKQSKLNSEVLSDSKRSGSIESENVSLNQSELGSVALSGNIQSGSTERDDDSLKQSKLGGRTQYDNKPSSSMERKDDLLKLGGGTRSDTKQSSSLASGNDSLKQSSLEAGQSTTKKRSHSSLDSVSSKRMKETTPFKQKGKYFTAQSESELEGEAPSDNKPSGSMERDDTLLKQSELELKAGEPSAKNMWRSGLSSMPSVPIIEITPFTQHSTIVHKKRPLEKSAEGAAEKYPRLGGRHSDIFHSANLAIDNPLLKHRPKLAKFYSQQPEVPEDTMSWPPVKKTQYINLALIRTEQTIDFYKDYVRQTVRGSIDDIMKDKDDITYDNVFAEMEEGARLLFEGRSGCGKTTIMNKVSQDWAKWKIFSSCLLFLVHLRRFANRSDIDLETVLRFTPVDFSEEEFQQIQTHIEDNQGEGVVFALDGLDEYCPDMKTTYVHKLIKGQILPKSIVIVASRPAASQKYRGDATRCIEVLGFLKEQVYEYVDSYFDGYKDKYSLVLGLQTYLEHHPNVLHMCYLPLHMAMVTYLYDVERASLPQTETEIYHRFTLFTLLRSIYKRDEMEIDDEEEFYFQSFNDLQPEDRGIFDCILKLAYEATVVNPQQVFSAEEVKKFNVTSRRSNDTTDSDNSLGLVVVDKYFVRYGLKEIYTFLHITFQEFLSACHIVQLDSQAQEEIILKYGSNKSLGVVWKFYCGMTQFSGEKMRNFKHLVEQTKSEILLHLRCAHESQQVILCTHTLDSYGSKIILNSLSLNPADFTALGYVLTHSNVPATELAITSCNIGPEGLSALEKAVNSSLALETLSFHGTKVKKMIPELCSVLTKFPQLRNLILSSCGITMKSLSEMAEILSVLESVEQLDLSRNDFGVKSVEILCSLLTRLPKLKNLVWDDGLLTISLFDYLIARNIGINLVVSKSSKGLKQELFRFGIGGINFDSSYFQAHPYSAVVIQEIILHDRSINDTDAQSLAKILPYCLNLQQLNLKRNGIGVAGAQALAEGLQHCSNLQELNLCGNKINVAGAQALAKGLQHCTNLQRLNVGYNGIGDAGGQALAEGLQHCTNLQQLDVEYNSIGDASAQALAEGLQHCINFQELNSQSNNLTDSSIGSLSQLIRTAKQLNGLYLWNNHFTDGGQRALKAAAEERNSYPDFAKLDVTLTRFWVSRRGEMGVEWPGK